MTRHGLSLATLLAAGIFLSPRPFAQTPAAPPADLVSLFAANGLTRDTNGDGIADTVAARVIVPAQPALEDSLAAANLAARLGFETSAFSLPLVVRDDQAEARSSALPILVGRSNSFVRALAAKNELALTALKPGQGLIALVSSPFGNGPAIVVAGGDDKGTLAAANVVAGRLPRLWNMTGVTLKGLADQARQYLIREGVSVSRLSIGSIVVDSDRRGIQNVGVRAEVAPGQSERAVTALKNLNAAHRRGLEPQTLNFAEIATVTVDMGNGTATRAEVARAGLNARTLTPPIDPNELATDSPGDRGRPADGAGAARGGTAFDLSNPFSIDGWFGDNYSRPDSRSPRHDHRHGLQPPRRWAPRRSPRVLVSRPPAWRFPVAKSVDDVRDASREQSPILIGRDNRLVQDLVKIGRARLDDLKHR